MALLCKGCCDDGTEEFLLFWFSWSSNSASLFHKKLMMSFASSGESKSGGGGNVFLFIPPDYHHKKITPVECGIMLTRPHNFGVKALRVKSYQNHSINTANNQGSGIHQRINPLKCNSLHSY